MLHLNVEGRVGVLGIQSTAVTFWAAVPGNGSVVPSLPCPGASGRHPFPGVWVVS